MEKLQEIERCKSEINFLHQKNHQLEITLNEQKELVGTLIRYKKNSNLAQENRLLVEENNRLKRQIREMQ